MASNKIIRRPSEHPVHDSDDDDADDCDTGAVSLLYRLLIKMVQQADCLCAQNFCYIKTVRVSCIEILLVGVESYVLCGRINYTNV